MIQRPLARRLRQVVDDELRVFDRALELLGRDLLVHLLVAHQQRLELARRDRLDERADDGETERAPVLLGRDDDTAVETARDDDLGRAARIGELAQQLDAVAARHLQIEQDDVRVESPERVDEARGIREHGDVEAELLAHLAEELRNVRIVVHDE